MNRIKKSPYIKNKEYRLRRFSFCLVLLAPAPKQGMVGASNFHLLGVGAEKSSLYRLGLLGFDAYLIIKNKGKV